MLYNVHTPTTCMKRYTINVHIRISGYCKQLVKWRALQLSELLQILFSINKNIPLKTKPPKTQFFKTHMLVEHGVKQRPSCLICCHLYTI